MKVLVAIKRVVDYKAVIRVKADKSAVETANVKMSLNPFDEIAIEEAIRLKEKGTVQEIIAVSIGDIACQETLRSALAMGADRAILVKTEEAIQPLGIAKLLQHLALENNVSLVLLGKQAIDSDDNQVGQMLAALLNWPQGTFASKVVVSEKHIEVTREIDGGLETLQLTLPAVITTDLRLNEPRFISLPNIVKAKKKPLSIVDIATIGVDTAPRFKVIEVNPPAKRQAGTKVADVQELLQKLKSETQVKL